MQRLHTVLYIFPVVLEGTIGSRVTVTTREVLLRIMRVRHLVSWMKLFFHVPEMYKIYPSFNSFKRRLVFITEEDFLLLQLFVYFFQRVSSLAESSPGWWIQPTLIRIYSTFVCLGLISFQWKWLITETRFWIEEIESTTCMIGFT